MLQAVGHAAGAVRSWYYGFENALNGWPDYALSVALIITGCVAIVAGLVGPRWLKLLMLAWMWFP